MEGSSPGLPTVAGSQPGTTRAAADALTDTPPVHPARLMGLDLGPACNQCGREQRRDIRWKAPGPLVTCWEISVHVAS